MKKYTLLIFIIIMCFMLILAGGFLLFVQKNKACIDNPFTYAAKITSEEAESDLMCSCSFQDPRFDNFYFTKDKVKIGNYFDSAEDDSIFFNNAEEIPFFNSSLSS